MSITLTTRRDGKAAEKTFPRTALRTAAPRGEEFSDAGLVGPDRGSRHLHIVLTSVSSDSHTWNLVFLQMLLEWMGHTVTNLGACTPDAEVIDACGRHAPDLLVVSTVNGHGNIDGERLIRRLRDEPHLSNLPAVIGGLLSVRGPDDHAAVADRLLRAGFSAVFEPATLQAFCDMIQGISAQAPRLIPTGVAA